MRCLSRLIPLALVSAIAFGPGAGLARATTIEDLVKLKSGKAPVSDEVLIALIESDGSVFHLTPEDLKPLKEKGFSDRLIVAMLLTGARARGTLIPLDPPATKPAPMALPPPPPVEVNVSGPGGTTRYSVQPDPEMQPQAPPQQAPVVVNITQQVTQTVEQPPPQQPYYNSPVYYAYPVVYPVAPIVRRPIEPIYWGYGGQRRPDTWAPTRGEILGQIPKPTLPQSPIRPVR